MQIIKAGASEMMKPIKAGIGIVDDKPGLSILENVLIRKDGERISFITSDIEIEIHSAADIGDGDGLAALTAPAKKLLGILRALPSDSEVQMSMMGNRLSVQSGKSRFLLQTLPAEQFPEIAQADYYADFSIPAANFRRMMSMVHYAMARGDVRYYLNGMLLSVEGSRLSAVASDGHRMAIFEIGLTSEAQCSAIVPRRAVTELLRLMTDGDDVVRVQVAANQVRFSFGAATLVSKLVDGRFPNYSSVIPAGNDKSFQIESDILSASLRRVAILAGGKIKLVRLELNTGVLKISATNDDKEEARDEVGIGYAGEPIEVGFNAAYLLDVLDALKGSVVNVALGVASDGALITAPGVDSFRYVVMPARV